jgi:hypothetical protein
VHDLVAASYTATLAGGLTAKGRETVAVVADAVKANKDQAVSLAKVHQHHDGLSKGAVSARLRVLVRLGYVVNENAGQDRAAPAYTVGAPLPPETPALPQPQHLEAAWRGSPPRPVGHQGEGGSQRHRKVTKRPNA